MCFALNNIFLFKQSIIWCFTMPLFDVLPRRSTTLVNMLKSLKPNISFREQPKVLDLLINHYFMELYQDLLSSRDSFGMKEIDGRAAKLY